MLASLIVGLILRTSSVSAAACYNPATVCGSNMPSTCNPDLAQISQELKDYCVANRNILFKTGLDDGSVSSGLSNIDNTFILCWESFTSCGRVTLIKSQTSSKCGQPWDDGTSQGVKIGGGIDLGREDIASLTALGASTDTLTKLSNYIGLQLWAAAEAVCATPLTIDVADAYALTTASIEKYAQEMETVYNAEKAADALPFNELPLGVKTVLVSIEYKWGHSFNAQFWEYIKVNDFEGAVYELLHFHGGSVSSARLRSEANVLTASLGCVTNIDCVFLVDESGSVTAGNFDLTLDWMAEFVGSFDESSLDQTDINIGTRFGVATFSSSSNLVDEFFLNAYTTTAEYTDHISAIIFNGGGTYLGAALTQVGVTQFTEANGMRAASVGIPRLLIVLTDGIAADDVVAGVATLDGLNLNIIAIGIGGYNLAQLEYITTTDKIYTIDGFTQLSTILDGVMTQTCYVPTQLNVGDVIADVSTEEGFTKYFQFETSGDVNANTVLNIDSTQGCVYVFVSYCSQYPSYYVNDVMFTSCGQPSKQIVLSPTLANCSEYEGDLRRRLQATTDTVFVAFEGRSVETAIFNMIVDVCELVSCAVGTNYDESLNVDEAYDIFEVVIETTTVTPTTTETITTEKEEVIIITTEKDEEKVEEAKGGSSGIWIGVFIGIAVAVCIMLIVYFVVIKPRMKARGYVRTNLTETETDTAADEDQQLI